MTEGEGLAPEASDSAVLRDDSPATTGTPENGVGAELSTPPSYPVVDKPASLDEALSRAMQGREKAPEAPKKAIDDPKPEIPAWPENWPAARRAVLEGVTDPNVRKAVLDQFSDLEKGLQRTISEKAEAARLGEGIRSIIDDDLREQLRASNMDEVSGLKWLVDLHQNARRDPQGYIKWVMGQAGLTPEELFGDEYASGEEGGDDPRDRTIQQLQYQVAELSKGFGSVQSHLQSQSQSAMMAEVERFAGAKDGTGNPLHPHFDAVQDKLVELLALPAYKAIPSPADRLEKAYSDAVYLHPEVREQVLKSEFEKRRASERKTQDLRRAEAAAPPITDPGELPSSAPKKAASLDEALRMAVETVGG